MKESVTLSLSDIEAVRMSLEAQAHRWKVQAVESGQRQDHRSRDHELKMAERYEKLRDRFFGTNNVVINYKPLD